MTPEDRAFVELQHEAERFGLENYQLQLSEKLYELSEDKAGEHKAKIQQLKLAGADENEWRRSEPLRSLEAAIQDALDGEEINWITFIEKTNEFNQISVDGPTQKRLDERIEKIKPMMKKKLEEEFNAFFRSKKTLIETNLMQSFCDVVKQKKGNPSESWKNFINALFSIFVEQALKELNDGQQPSLYLLSEIIDFSEEQSGMREKAMPSIIDRAWDGSFFSNPAELISENLSEKDLKITQPLLYEIKNRLGDQKANSILKKCQFKIIQKIFQNASEETVANALISKITELQTSAEWSWLKKQFSENIVKDVKLLLIEKNKTEPSLTQKILNAMEEDERQAYQRELLHDAFHEQELVDWEPSFRLFLNQNELTAEEAKKLLLILSEKATPNNEKACIETAEMILKALPSHAEKHAVGGIDKHGKASYRKNPIVSAIKKTPELFNFLMNHTIADEKRIIEFIEYPIKNSRFVLPNLFAHASSSGMIKSFWILIDYLLPNDNAEEKEKREKFLSEINIRTSAESQINFFEQNYPPKLYPDLYGKIGKFLMKENWYNLNGSQEEEENSALDYACRNSPDFIKINLFFIEKAIAHANEREKKRFNSFLPSVFTRMEKHLLEEFYIKKSSEFIPLFDYFYSGKMAELKKSVQTEIPSKNWSRKFMPLLLMAKDPLVFWKISCCFLQVEILLDELRQKKEMMSHQQINEVFEKYFDDQQKILEEILSETNTAHQIKSFLQSCPIHVFKKIKEEIENLLIKKIQDRAISSLFFQFSFAFMNAQRSAHDDNREQPNLTLLRKTINFEQTDLNFVHFRKFNTLIEMALKKEWFPGGWSHITIHDFQTILENLRFELSTSYASQGIAYVAACLALALHFKEDDAMACESGLIAWLEKKLQRFPTMHPDRITIFLGLLEIKWPIPPLDGLSLLGYLIKNFHENASPSDQQSLEAKLQALEQTDEKSADPAPLFSEKRFQEMLESCFKHPKCSPESLSKKLFDVLCCLAEPTFKKQHRMKMATVLYFIDISQHKPATRKTPKTKR